MMGSNTSTIKKIKSSGAFRINGYNLDDVDLKTDCATLGSMHDEINKPRKTKVIKSTVVKSFGYAKPKNKNSRDVKDQMIPKLPARLGDQMYTYKSALNSAQIPFYKPTLFVLLTERLIYLVAYIFVVGTILYASFNVIITIKQDLSTMANEHTRKLQAITSDCLHNYEINKCQPNTRVQYMNEQCTNWEICMNQKPNEILYLKTAAEVASITANAFFDNLSYKSLIFIGFFTLALLLVVIRGMSLHRLDAYREKMQYHDRRDEYCSNNIYATKDSALSTATESDLKN